MVNRLISIVSVVIIAILLVVSVFLISNTVAMGISVRKEEIGIMKLIGATNAFVRLPFILEGILIGLVGAVIPLTLLYFLYNQAVQYILARFSILNEFMNGLIPVNNIFRVLLPAGIILGMGIGFVGSMVTIRKHLKYKRKTQGTGDIPPSPVGTEDRNHQIGVIEWKKAEV